MFLFKKKFNYTFQIVLFPSNMEINSLYASKDATYHSVQTCHAMRVYLLSATLRFILFILSPWYAPLSSALHRAFSSHPPTPIPPFFRSPFFFFTRPPSPLYTRYAYILQLVVKHRDPCLSFPFAKWATTTPFGHERYHGLWAGRGLYRLAINRQEITIEIRDACPRVKVAYERRAGT